METEKDQFLRAVCLLEKHNITKRSIPVISHCLHCFPPGRADNDVSSSTRSRALSLTLSEYEEQAQDNYQQHRVGFPNHNKVTGKLSPLNKNNRSSSFEPPQHCLSARSFVSASPPQFLLILWAKPELGLFFLLLNVGKMQ